MNAWANIEKIKNVKVIPDGSGDLLDNGYASQKRR